MSTKSVRKSMALAILGLCFVQGATATPWFENPQLKGKLFETNAPAATSKDSHYMNKSEDDQYLGVVFQSSNVNGPACLYRMADLEAINGITSNSIYLASVMPDELSRQGYTGYVGLFKGCALDVAHNRMFVGDGGSAACTALAGFFMTNIYNRAWCYTNIGNHAATAYSVKKDNVCTMDGIDFGHNGEYLYSDVYWGADAGTRTNLLQWTVGADNSLTLTKKWYSNVVRVRCVNSYYINGQDWLFYGEGGATAASGTLGKVYVANPSTGVNTLLCTLTDIDSSLAIGEPDDIMNVKLSGVGSAQMYMYVQLNAGPLFIYKLSFTGSVWTATFLKEYTYAQIEALAASKLNASATLKSRTTAGTRFSFRTA